MNPTPEHPIARVVEEIESQVAMSLLLRRMLGFKKAGVAEFWAVDRDGQRIHAFRLRHDSSLEGKKVPPDWEQAQEEFFGTNGGIEP